MMNGNVPADRPIPTAKIWLRGPMVFRGYHKLPEETAKALTPDGYFKSGDIGRIDDEGYLFITGRKKELIIVAGEKAVPREIEDVLLKHPAVADAAVVGKPDPKRGRSGRCLRDPEGKRESRTCGPTRLRPGPGLGAVEGAARGDDRRRTAAFADGKGAETRAVGTGTG